MIRYFLLTGLFLMGQKSCQNQETNWAWLNFLRTVLLIITKDSDEDETYNNQNQETNWAWQFPPYGTNP